MVSKLNKNTGQYLHVCPLPDLKYSTPDHPRCSCFQPRFGPGIALQSTAQRSTVLVVGAVQRGNRFPEVAGSFLGGALAISRNYLEKFWRLKLITEKET